MWRHLRHTNASARDRVLRRARPPAPPVHQCWLRGGVRGLAKFPRRNGPAGRRGPHPPSLGNIDPRGFEGGVWTPGSRCVWHARTCEISSVNSLAHAASCEISAVNSLARRRKCVDGPIVWPAGAIVCGVPFMGTWRRAACRRRGRGWSLASGVQGPRASEQQGPAMGVCADQTRRDGWAQLAKCLPSAVDLVFLRGCGHGIGGGGR